LELIWNLFGTYLELIWNLFGTYFLYILNNILQISNTT